MIYKIPNLKEDEKSYYVPCVMKNRDTLLGFIDACYLSEGITGLEIVTNAFSSLGCDRFCDTTRDDRKLRYMTKQEIYVYAKSVVEKLLIEPLLIKDDVTFNKESVLDMTYFSVSCNCANYYGFKTKLDVPKHNLVCSCGRLLIDYTKTDDENFEYDGIDSKGNKLLHEFVISISNELFGDEYEDDERESNAR